MRIAEKLDEFVFIKNNYSIIKHLVPFSIAALFLIILSVPKEDLLVRLAKLLQHPSFLWGPAAILTITAIIVYYFTIKAQIQKAYLWDYGISRRSKLTAIMYIFICTVMASVILSSSSTVLDVTSDVWPSLLIAVLSLTGIGWSTPGTWVESMGINCPDYTQAHLSANQIKKILTYIRESNGKLEKSHIDDFVKFAGELRDNIRINLEIEPKDWLANKNLNDAMQSIDELIKSITDDDFHDPEDFRVTCQYDLVTINSRTVESLKKAEQFWKDWQSTKR